MPDHLIEVATASFFYLSQIAHDSVCNKCIFNCCITSECYVWWVGSLIVVRFLYSQSLPLSKYFGKFLFVTSSLFSGNDNGGDGSYLSVKEDIIDEHCGNFDYLSDSISSLARIASARSKKEIVDHQE